MKNLANKIFITFNLILQYYNCNIFKRNCVQLHVYTLNYVNSFPGGTRSAKKTTPFPVFQKMKITQFLRQQERIISMTDASV